MRTNPALIRHNHRILNGRKPNTLARYFDSTAWGIMKRYQRWLITKA